MKLASTVYFDKSLKKRLSKNLHLKQKVQKQLGLLVSDFHHPSLKTHKLKGNRGDQYSIWIEGDLRITFILLEETILLTDIITHDEY